MQSRFNPRYQYGAWAHRMDDDDAMDALYGDDWEREDDDELEDERDNDEELTDA